MEVAQQFLTDFWKCVVFHSTKWRDTAVFEVTHFMDVDRHLQAEIQANEELKTRIAEAKARADTLEADHAAQLEAERAVTRDIRKQFALLAKPLLERYDSISLAKHYYSETMNLVGQHEYTMQQLQARETSGYGYQSKRLISIGLTLQALKQRASAGEPFAVELNALISDAESPSLTAVAAPLERFASVGLPDDRTVRTSALVFARAMEESAKYRPSQIATSWFDKLKFGNVAGGPPSSTTMQQQKMKIAVARDAAQLFLSRVDQGDWSGALTLADTDFASMTTSTATSVNAEYQVALAAFKKEAVPHALTNQFLEYATGNLTCSRMSFVERMLKIE